MIDENNNNNNIILIIMRISGINLRSTALNELALYTYVTFVM